MLKRRHSLCLLLVALISFAATGCELVQTRPGEEDVWRAFVQAHTERDASSNANSTQTLPRSEYTIIFIGQNGAIIGTPTISTECFPDALKASTESLEGVQYLYEVRTRADNVIWAKIEFTKWTGIDNWWVWASGYCFEYKQ